MHKTGLFFIDFVYTRQETIHTFAALMVCYKENFEKSDIVQRSDNEETLCYNIDIKLVH